MSLTFVSKAVSPAFMASLPLNSTLNLAVVLWYALFGKVFLRVEHEDSNSNAKITMLKVKYGMFVFVFKFFFLLDAEK